MSDWPIMLRMAGRRGVVVGGGRVAARRVGSLIEAGADVVVIAPKLCETIEALCREHDGVAVERRAYRTGDLEGAVVAVAATDDAQVNQQIQRDAAATGVWVNRADDPDTGDFTVPAHKHVGPITVAVHTGGISAAAAAAMRDAMLDALDDDWLTLLRTVEPMRQLARQRIPDTAARLIALRRMVDAEAMAVLKQRGEDALRLHCKQIMDRA